MKNVISTTWQSANKYLDRFLSYFKSYVRNEQKAKLQEDAPILIEQAPTGGNLSDSLKADLISEMEIEQIFQKHVVDGPSYFFTNILNQKNLEYELRHELAHTLSVSINDVIIVGSAKLGYSLKSEIFQTFDQKFRDSRLPKDKSDIDIAIINRRFYERSVEEIYHLSRHFNEGWIRENWRTNVFYRQPSELHINYALYLARGWMRPDFLPNVYFDQAAWRPVCDAWYRKLSRRKLSVGIYSDWIYLKHYQMDNLSRLKEKISKLEVME